MGMVEGRAKPNRTVVAPVVKPARRCSGGLRPAADSRLGAALGRHRGELVLDQLLVEFDQLLLEFGVLCGALPEKEHEVGEERPELRVGALDDLDGWEDEWPERGAGHLSAPPQRRGWPACRGRAGERAPDLIIDRAVRGERRVLPALDGWTRRPGARAGRRGQGPSPAVARQAGRGGG